MQDLFGGSKQSAQQSSASGFGALPPDIQNIISQLATSAGSTLNPSGTPNTSIETLPALTQPSQSALSQIQNQDFAITPESIQTDINEQMNPYDQSVINQIERAQNGSLSQLNSYLTNTGTYGSNRGELGANDIAQTAADQVGGFLNSEYNTNLNNALTTIPQNRAQSAAGSVSGGQFTQQQSLQNQQAPITALAQLAQILQQGIPATSTGQGSSSGSSVNGGGLFGGAGSTGFGNITGALGTLASLF